MSQFYSEQSSYMSRSMPNGHTLSLSTFHKNNNGVHSHQEKAFDIDENGYKMELPFSEAKDILDKYKNNLESYEGRKKKKRLRLSKKRKSRSRRSL